MLKISGASDDLVSANIDTVTRCEHCGTELENDDAAHGHVQSDVEDEFSCYDQNIEFTIGDDDGGVVVKMAYGNRGVWTAEVGQIQEDRRIPWPVSIKSVSEYSVEVAIDCPNGTKVTWRKESAS